MVSLALPCPDAQLLAVVVAIRGARGGVGNVTGADLAALRLDDPRGAVDALRGLGWGVADALLDGDPVTPVPITVPDLAREVDHPLSFGESKRSRVSGWASRTLSAKQVKKLPPAARLAGLFVAAHGTSEHLAPLPPGLPESCRAALPDLLRKGFLAELSEDHGRLDPAVCHLSGLRPPAEEERSADAPDGAGGGVSTARQFRFSADTWARWKDSATPALRRHVEAVEYCAVCALRPERVAEAFMVPSDPRTFTEKTEAAYAKWKDAHPDRGPLAAEFTVAFRAEHGHGPSYGQLSSGLGWKLKRGLRGLVVERLVHHEWLMGTGTVPWTLRPGQAAQAQGITLPRARSSVAAPQAGARSSVTAPQARP
ncbi:hypothetical protein [Streptomyces corynorhini]|uniref:hypothetical protein n=1 Tax=Streptomyces corynorhini TaxID=2282652 RepID=UPI001F227B6A|nr:hypothetical protein [Streptomyces corynorhini]